MCRLSGGNVDQVTTVCTDGAIALLDFVATEDASEPELSERVRSKAAVALGNIAATPDGLDAIQRNCGECHFDSLEIMKILKFVQYLVQKEDVKSRYLLNML